MQDDPWNTYRSPSRKLLENAENADIEFSMAVLASAVRARARIRVSVRTWISDSHTREIRFLRTCRCARVRIGANQHGF